MSNNNPRWARPRPTFLVAVASVALGGLGMSGTASAATGSQPASLLGQRVLLTRLVVTPAGATCPTRANVRVWSVVVPRVTKQLPVTRFGTKCAVSGVVLLPSVATTVKVVTAAVSGAGLLKRTLYVRRPTTGAIRVRVVNAAGAVRTDSDGLFCPADGRFPKYIDPMHPSRTAQGLCGNGMKGLALLRNVKPGSWTVTILGGLGSGPCYNTTPAQGFTTCTRVAVKVGYITVVNWNVPPWG